MPASRKGKSVRFQIYFEGYPGQKIYIGSTIEAEVIFKGVVVVVFIVIFIVVVLRCLGFSPALEDFPCLFFGAVVVFIVVVVVVVRCVVVE